jgi:hypothetical protein
LSQVRASRGHCGAGVGGESGMRVESGVLQVPSELLQDVNTVESEGGKFACNVHVDVGARAANRVY